MLKFIYFCELLRICELYNDQDKLMDFLTKNIGINHVLNDKAQKSEKAIPWIFFYIFLQEQDLCPPKPVGVLQTFFFLFSREIRDKKSSKILMVHN